MRFQSQSTLEDVLAFNRFHAANSPASKGLRRTVAITHCMTSLSAGLLVAATDWSLGGLQAAVTYSAILFLFLLAARGSAGDKAVRRLYGEGQNKRFLRPFTMDLDETGIVETSDLSAHRYAWAAVEKVGCDESHLYLYTGSIGAIILSRSTVGEANWGILLALVRGLARANGIPTVGKHWPPEVLPPPLPITPSQSGPS